MIIQKLLPVLIWGLPLTHFQLLEHKINIEDLAVIMQSGSVMLKSVHLKAQRAVFKLCKGSICRAYYVTTDQLQACQVISTGKEIWQVNV